MRKTGSLLLTLGMVVLSLAGCAPEEEVTQTTESEVSSMNEEPSAAAEDSMSVSSVYGDPDTATAGKTFTVRGDKADFSENNLWDGLGFISANNSSRLLLDYKTEQPEAYRELLNYMFSEDGLGLQLLKLEMGADVDSSSGTEPAVKRSAEEEADVTRGAGFQLAADALAVNPDLKIDMLSWGTPAWVASAEDPYDAAYQWYKETLDAAYDTYGIRFYSITASKNERSNDAEWIKYLSDRLKNETDERYDYSEILIVAGEGVTDWNIARYMLTDEDLMNAVDIVSSHYTSFTNDNVLKLKNEYGKKVWFSEGSSPMSEEAVTRFYDGTGTGLSDINGVLDIATRITQAAASGMTMYEFQPAVSAYYSGVTYFPKQLVQANEPWSGAYTLDAGYYMALHFARFIKSDWAVLTDACFGDGKAGGDGHAIVDSTYNYMTAVSSDATDFSSVLVNNSSETIAYTVRFRGISNTTVHVWETKGPDSDADAYDSNYFKYRAALTPEEVAEGVYEVTVVMQPYSMMTVTTLDVSEGTYENGAESSVLALPYSDDFEYTEYADDYLKSRGMAPRYTTDQAGAFEVVETSEGNILMQKIDYDNKATEWGSSGNPSTNLGDDRWTDYTFSADVLFDDARAETDKVNYVGIGVRYNLADFENSGYSLRLYEDGNVQLMSNSTVLSTAVLEGLDLSVWHKLALTADENRITCAVDGEVLIEYTDAGAFSNSGRIALYSDYQNNCFDNLLVTALGDSYAITRYDNLDSSIAYSYGSNDKNGDGWYFETMCSYKNYGRTLSTGGAGDSFTVTLRSNAEALALIGRTSGAVISVKAGDTVLADRLELPNAVERQTGSRIALPEGTTSVTIEVLEGTFCLDAVEY